MNRLAIMANGLVIAVGIAHADPLVSSNDWSGLYAGANVGGVFNSLRLNSQQIGFTNLNERCDISSVFSSIYPGAQLGYMHPFATHLVSGIEANVGFNTHQKDILSCNCPNYSEVSDRFTFRNQIQSSLRGRVGLAFHWNQYNLLPYFMAGASLATLGLTYTNESGDYYSENKSQAGLLVGAGVEWAFWKNGSLRLEYSYVDYRSGITLKLPSLYGLEDPNGVARVNLNANTVLMAFNYWM